MSFSSLLSGLRQINEEDLYEFLYDLYVDHAPPEKQHLGYVDKSRDLLQVTLPKSNIDLTISQSLSGLSSGKETSSTGFICWQSAIYMADWILADSKCPFSQVFEPSSKLLVLELGAGVGGVLASVVGPKVGHYVASDQRHILKLLKSNFAANVVSLRYTSATTDKADGGQPKRTEDIEWSKIDFIEFDWERRDIGTANFALITGRNTPDIIIATDTIYNEYLIPHFVASLKAMMSDDSIAILVVQLRDEDIVERFLQEVYDQNLFLHAVPDHLLSRELLQGFMVICITRISVEL